MIDIDMIHHQGGLALWALLAIAGWMAGLMVRQCALMAMGYPLRSRLPVLAALVAIAPLVGLLGTVVGLVQVFGADVPPDTVAAGISQALLSTQVGLVIAVPGLIARQLLLRWHELRQAHQLWITSA